MAEAPLPKGEDKALAVRKMFDSIAPRYDLVNRIMTFGMDIGWRRRAVAGLDLRPGSLVIDVACGTGDFCREIQKVGATAIGFDVSLGMLKKARTSAPLVQADGLGMPLRDGAADAITCGFALRNVVDIDVLFGEFARVMRQGGHLAVIEVAEPKSKVLRAGHHAYFHKVVPMIGGLLSDKEAYSYLPRSTAYLPETEELLEMLRTAGFVDARMEPLGLGAAQLISAVRS
jgi:demethylmenaquinone methyltransferase / 2-methoxy-6-polyprenyl-1,4-benzoquinol methylase